MNEKNHNKSSTDCNYVKSLELFDILKQYQSEVYLKPGGVNMWDRIYNTFPSYRTFDTNYSQLMKQKYQNVHRICMQRLE